MEVAFRVTARDMMDTLYHVATMEHSPLKDQTARGLVVHDMAAWAIEIDHDAARGLVLHRQALDLAREGKDSLAVIRMKVGAAFAKSHLSQRPLAPQLRIKDFSQYAKQYRAVGDDADALRVECEVAYAWFDKARASSSVDLALLAFTEKMTKDILTAAKHMQYPNVIILAKELLSRCALLRGKDLQAKKLYREAQQLRKTFAYVSRAHRYGIDTDTD
jgi:hypothetical protein